jgi:hypothetical protein
LIGIAFAALLVFGLWWWMPKPTPYSIVVEDVYGSFGWTSRTYVADVNEFRGFRKGNLVAVFVAPHSEREAMLELSKREQIIMRLENDGAYPDAGRKVFANAVIVCGDPDDCKPVYYSIRGKAENREAAYRAAGNR